MNPTTSDPFELLRIEHLDVQYITESASVPACLDVNLTVRADSILGIAGESGSGKSTLIAAITRLQRPPAVTTNGRVLLRRPEGYVDLVRLTEKQLRPLRWSAVSTVFQSAMDALNPVRRLGAQFVDVMRAHDRSLSHAAAMRRAAELVEMVGIRGTRLSAYPHEMSGGMRQRASIALSLACNPDLVIMDEPTTAVDVVMQRQILGQILKLKEQFHFAVIFVTHDLSLLLEFADDVAVMYGGRVVEVGPASAIYRNPLHPYSAGLRDSFPPLQGARQKILGIPGSPPDPRNPPPGCPYAPRCPKVFAACTLERPELLPHGERRVACLLHDPDLASIGADHA
ncbi:ABC transporter ATP-binding protein [Microbacteriaceae bacterium VKM Ac-2854]|nr:ABC transporter ATP-binding protein [Microbacteriaceae bacterium VKM Ac-2854]